MSPPCGAEWEGPDPPWREPGAGLSMSEVPLRQPFYKLIFRILVLRSNKVVNLHFP